VWILTTDVERRALKLSLNEVEPMVAYLALLLSVVACAPAFAGGVAPISAPELDPGSLAALTTGMTGAYFIYRVYRTRKNKV
jgi:hypothetical protein